MAKNTTEGLYQAVIDNVASLLAAVKGEAKANKRLGNSVARLDGFREKPCRVFNRACQDHNGRQGWLTRATKKAAAKPATAKSGKTRRQG